MPIDGKTMRGSYTKADKSDLLYIVSAWASAQGITLGQVAVDSKSNEITAIPKLLEMLELHGDIVLIDAMGCQQEIAAKIVSGGGDYSAAPKRSRGRKHELPTSACYHLAQAGHFEVMLEAKAKKGGMGHRFPRNSPVSVRF